jgi:hypothetical protein
LVRYVNTFHVSDALPRKSRTDILHAECNLHHQSPRIPKPDRLTWLIATIDASPEEIDLSQHAYE